MTDSFYDKYKDIILEKLDAWPTNKKINWSSISRECEINEKNGGQKVK